MKTIRNLLAAFTIMFCLGAGELNAQSMSIYGVVWDDMNSPMAGVTVMVKNTANGTVTDANGYFRINVTKGETLVFAFIGFDTQEIEVTGDKTALDVYLKPTLHVLDEVVITGYATQRKVSVTGAVVSISGDRISRRAGRRSRGLDGATAGAYMSSPSPQAGYSDMYYPGSETHTGIKENRFTSVAKDPLSTFALEVDVASYGNVRRMLNLGQMPDADAVRVEEFVNYFSYDYPKATGKEPVRVNYEVAQCPWNEKHQLVRIGVKAKEIATEEMPGTNFVFLIDVSGSMYGRLELVQSSMKLLVNNLRKKDRVSIVTYASGVRLALPATSGSDKQKIREALDMLTAGGGTSGAAGIQLAYKTARENFIDGGNNRIILATDGDFNVGASSPEELQKLIETERKSGVFLTVLGYGMGNYRDDMMQTLAEKGNGNYAYIDNMQEANKVLVNEFGGTMYTVAKDVKLQVEFNPAKVQSFRLVGYESRLLEHEDFNDDTVDAGEIGAGHTVTALYEIVPVGVESNVGGGSIDPLKYQTGESDSRRAVSNNLPDLMTVKIRYKAPDSDVSEKYEVPIIDNGSKPSEDFWFSSSVAMFAQLLRDSDFKGDATYDLVLKNARKGLGEDEYGYRREFVKLVEVAKGLSGNK